jgi:peptide/nickel transport system permease protein
VHLDLGTSYQMHMPVVRVLAERLPRTLWLALAALAVEVILGVSAGVIAAVKRNTLLDHGALAVALLGISAPTFFVGVLLQYLLGYHLRWLPLDGYGSTFGEHAVSLILPALTLGMAGAAYYTRLVRDDMIDILRQDYVRTARAKGVSAGAVVVRHALRNAVLPLITVIGLDFGGLLGGAVVIEKLFRWPGLGQLSVDSVFARDAPIILGAVIVSSAAVVTLSFVVDVSYTLLDPRIRRAHGR